MTGEQRKRSIAETTVRIVAQYGLRGTTIARIAAAEGISEKALYKQYANRREILVAALDCVLDQAENVLHGLEKTNAVEYLRVAAELHCPSRPDFLYPLYEFLTSSPQEDLRRELKPRHLADIEFLMGVIEEGKAQGVIRPDVDAELAAWEFWAVCWAEDNAYIMGVDDYGPSGLSKRMIESYIQRISTEGAGAVNCGSAGGVGGASDAGAAEDNTDPPRDTKS
jgi:AcrR family transcriptional regulator